MKDFVTISLLETTKLMNTDLLFRGNAAMDEGSSYITLHRAKAKFCSKYHNYSYRRPLYDWCPSLKKVDPFFLTVSTSTETSLEFLDSTIRKPFNLEGPRTRKDIHCWESWYKIPALESFTSVFNSTRMACQNSA